MGAAKNARKARRKARKSQDRRPYFYPVEIVQKRGGGHNSVFRDADVVYLTNYRGHKEIVGYRVTLTHDEAKALLRAGIAASKEPKSWGDLTHFAYSRLSDLKMDGYAVTDTMLTFAGHHLGSSSVSGSNMADWRREYLEQTYARDGSRPNLRPQIDSAKLLKYFDFSELESRIMATLDKKAAYAALYGAREEDVKAIYTENQEVPAHVKADPLQRTYLGMPIGDIVRSHPMNRRDQNDQDHQALGGVSGHRARAIVIDDPRT